MTTIQSIKTNPVAFQGSDQPKSKKNEKSLGRAVGSIFLPGYGQYRKGDNSRGALHTGIWATILTTQVAMHGKEPYKNIFDTFKSMFKNGVLHEKTNKLQTELEQMIKKTPKNIKRAGKILSAAAIVNSISSVVNAYKAKKS